jgi:hypothetical protein
MSNDATTREGDKSSAESPGFLDIRQGKPAPLFFGMPLIYWLICCIALVGPVWLSLSIVKYRQSDSSALNLQHELPSLDIKYPAQRLQQVEHRTFMAQCDETDLLCLQVATQDPAATFQMLSAAMPKNGERRYLLRIAVTPLDADDSPASPAPTRLQQTIAY